MTISRRMLLAIVATLAGCNEAVPEGFRAASVAIAEAQQFNKSAADCRERGREYRSCTKAIELYERVRSTPTHFATQSEWRKFSDAYQRRQSDADGRFERSLRSGGQANCNRKDEVDVQCAGPAEDPTCSERNARTSEGWDVKLNTMATSTATGRNLTSR